MTNHLARCNIYSSSKGASSTTPNLNHIITHWKGILKMTAEKIRAIKRLTNFQDNLYFKIKFGEDEEVKSVLKVLLVEVERARSNLYNIA